MSKKWVRFLVEKSAEWIYLEFYFYRPIFICSMSPPTTLMSRAWQLEEILLSYSGVIFTVSHDRRFLNRVCNKIIAFEPGNDDAESKLSVYTGNYDSYLKQSEALEKPESKVGTKKPERVKSKKVKRSFQEEEELKNLPKLLEKLEGELALLHQELAEPESFKGEHKLLQEKIALPEKLGQEIERLYGRWQELSDIGE